MAVAYLLSTIISTNRGFTLHFLVSVSFCSPMEVECKKQLCTEIRVYLEHSSMASLTTAVLLNS